MFLEYIYLLLELENAMPEDGLAILAERHGMTPGQLRETFARMLDEHEEVLRQLS